MRLIATRSLRWSAACFTSRLSSTSRRRCASVSAHVAVITNPRNDTPYVSSGFSTEPATSIRNESKYSCCQSFAARRLNSLVTISAMRNCPPTPRKSPVANAVAPL